MQEVVEQRAEEAPFGEPQVEENAQAADEPLAGDQDLKSYVVSINYFMDLMLFRKPEAVN